MPDFERITDALREHLAKTPESIVFLRGYSKGKTVARVQIAALSVLVAFAILIVAGTLP